MSQLEASRGCTQALQESFLTNEKEEGKMLTSKSTLKVYGYLLPSDVEVKKPQMEGCTDDLKVLEVLEDQDRTYY